MSWRSKCHFEGKTARLSRWTVDSEGRDGSMGKLPGSLAQAPALKTTISDE